MSPLSRRQLLVGGASILGGAVLAGGLTGCATGSTAASGADRLQFWHLLTGGDGAKMADLVRRADAATGVAAQQTVLAWGTPYYTKLAMASVGGRAPDLAIMHASRLEGYAPGGLLDTWDDDLLAEFGVRESDYPAAVWKKTFVDGKHYAVALDAHPFVQFYNTDILDKAGALGSDGRIVDISSPDQLLEVGRAIKGVTKTHGISYGYLNDGANLWRMLYTLYRQQGATMVFTPGKRAEYEKDAAMAALDFMKEMLDGDIAANAADGGTALAEFVSKKSGIMFTGVWDTPSMKDAKLPFDAQPIPTMYSEPAAYADSHTFVLPHQNVVDEQKRRDAHEFVAAIVKRSLSWAQAGHIPAYNPVTDSAEYKKLLPQAHYAGAADIANYDPQAWFTGAGSDFQTAVGNALQGVLLGQTKPEAGWDQLMGVVNKKLSEPNPAG